MRRSTVLTLAALILSTAQGCSSGPGFDATTQETTAASIKTMTTGMTDVQKREFALDCRDVAFPPGTPPDPKGQYAPLQGMTAAQIHAKAEEARAKAKK